MLTPANIGQNFWAFNLTPPHRSSENWGFHVYVLVWPINIWMESLHALYMFVFGVRSQYMKFYCSWDSILVLSSSLVTIIISFDHHWPSSGVVTLGLQDVQPSDALGESLKDRLSYCWEVISIVPVHLLVGVFLFLLLLWSFHEQGQWLLKAQEEQPIPSLNYNKT